ncbi:MAG: hypothetical protein CMC40_04350 [Flavobacteriaceae bacterium]|nr:hypothetical protein [Flavobacteriaceae bacterium]
MKYYKISEFIYFSIFCISFYQTFSIWNIDRERAYIFLLFGIISLGMFFFRRHYRKKFSNRKKND